MHGKQEAAANARHLTSCRAGGLRCICDQGVTDADMLWRSKDRIHWYGRHWWTDADASNGRWYDANLNGLQRRLGRACCQSSVLFRVLDKKSTSSA